MIEIRYYDTVDDALIGFSVAVARYKDQYVLCRHRERTTYEIPGGHREPGETVEQTARRELWEETGAEAFELTPVCVYSVTKDGVETFGMLYIADITRLGPLPQLEMAEVKLFDTLPDSWTYPDIQPPLIDKVRAQLAI